MAEVMSILLNAMAMAIDRTLTKPRCVRQMDIVRTVCYTLES